MYARSKEMSKGRLAIFLVFIVILFTFYGCDNSPEISTYTVTYDSNNATGGTPPDDQLKTQGEALTLAGNSESDPLVRDGYTFDGWNTAADGSGTSYAEEAVYSTDEELLLYAVWTGNGYTVTLDDTDGSGGSGTVSATAGEAMPTAVKPAREGYTFGGYFTAADGGGTQYYHADMSSAAPWDISGDTTLYAKWTVTTYTITYHLDGGTNDTSNPSSYTIVTADITLNEPTKTDRYFAGWYEEDAFVTEVTTISTGSTGNVELYAHWVDPTCIVTLDDAEGSGGSGTVSATMGEAMPTAVKPAREGYTFGGYFTAADGGGTQYYHADMSSAAPWDISGDTTLYAKWTVTTYTITYHLDGGTNDTSNPSSYTIVTADITLGEAAKESHVFAGWYEEASFVTEVTTISTGSTGNVELYAKWDLVKLYPSGESAFEFFGNSLAFDGNNLVVAAKSSNSAYIFSYDSITGSWEEEQKLTPEPEYENQYSYYGASVSISGDSVVIGDNNGGTDYIGTAHTYTYDNTDEEWKIGEVFLGESNNDQFGVAVSVDGDNLFIGSVNAGINDQGIVHTYIKSGDVWGSETALPISDSADNGYNDKFGCSVDIDGNYAIVGDEDYVYTDTGSTDSYRAGSATIYHYNGVAWEEMQILNASDASQGDRFGYSVAIDGDHAIVGAIWEDDSGNSDYDNGSAYIFQYDSSLGEWVEVKKITHAENSWREEFGCSVAIDGEYIVVGAHNSDVDDLSYTGSAFVYKNTGSDWVLDRQLTAPDASQNDKFGASVAVSGNMVVVGASNDEYLWPNENTGSVYLFTLE